MKMQNNQKWKDIRTSFREEMQKNIKDFRGMTDEMKQKMYESKTQMMEGFEHIHWAKEIFWVADNQPREELVLIRTDLKIPKIVENKDAFIKGMKVDTWQKTDALPAHEKPVAMYEVKWKFSMAENEHDKTLLFTNMLVYENFVQLEIVDSMIKYLKFLKPKDTFFMTYQTGHDVTEQLKSFGA